MSTLERKRQQRLEETKQKLEDALDQDDMHVELIATEDLEIHYAIYKELQTGLTKKGRKCSLYANAECVKLVIDY
jgi:hypothetical protein